MYLIGGTGMESLHLASQDQEHFENQLRFGKNKFKISAT
jgi:hypothetical protein